MSSLEIFAMVLLPISIAGLSVVAFYIQTRADRAVQKHIIRWTELRAESELSNELRSEGVPGKVVGPAIYPVTGHVILSEGVKEAISGQLSLALIGRGRMRRDVSQADFQIASEYTVPSRWGTYL